MTKKKKKKEEKRNTDSAKNNLRTLLTCGNYTVTEKSIRKYANITAPSPALNLYTTLGLLIFVPVGVGG